MKISIIGFGSFGKFMAKSLGDRTEIFVSDSLDKKEEAKEMGVRFVNLEEALKNKILILAVPMESLKGVLKNISKKILPGTLIFDVCSLKMFSCKLMKKILPPNCEIIGTHPLFGPQSAPKSIKGMKIVLCKIRSKEETFENIKNFCLDLGLEVFETSPKEHDFEMAFSQALTHFIGQIGKKMNLKRVQLGTKTFEDLMDLMDIIKNDSRALFENMQSMNPFAKEVRKRFLEEGKKLHIYLDTLEKNNKSLKR